MGLRIAHLTELAFRIGSARIEISERYGVNLVGALIVAKDALDHRLGGAVRVDWILRRHLAQ